MASSFDTTLSNLGIARTTGAGAVQASGASTLNQGDFLKLMTAQMKNQDPFDPVDNTQMVAQMAQFSSLAGISEMSSTLKAIADKLGGTSTADAVSYIGKTVLTAGDTAYARSSGGISGAIEIADTASDVRVTITDQNGGVLRTVSLGAQQAGTTSYDWDGTTDTGEAAGPGPYRVSVSAQNGGKTVAANNLVWAPVESVSTASGAALLTLPGIGQIPVTAVRSIG
ncbi:MAG TPA: flagellar hook capping FlgD N-terminal domain-containing protein [Sphingomonas sp.]|jgi:flagellar basal-body rod modification protein FlgD|nr:flagellar hook capping FlgD N-terminal domain-containing protein [Sphingomonas sp.]